MHDIRDKKAHGYELENNYYMSKRAFIKLLKHLMYTKNAIWNDNLYTKLVIWQKKISPKKKKKKRKG